jgi:hypothetical protein
VFLRHSTWTTDPITSPPRYLINIDELMIKQANIESTKLSLQEAFPQGMSEIKCTIKDVKNIN